MGNDRAQVSEDLECQPRALLHCHPRRQGGQQRSRGWGATGSRCILEASPGLCGEWLEEIQTGTLLRNDYRDPGLRNARAGPGDQLTRG